MVSNGFLPACCEAKETWSAACQSCVMITLANDFISVLMIGMTAAPSLTAKLPPGTKQFCTSITSKASVGLSARCRGLAGAVGAFGAAGLGGAAEGAAATAARLPGASKHPVTPNANVRREHDTGGNVMRLECPKRISPVRSGVVRGVSGH
jgi:hypothetical protein